MISTRNQKMILLALGVLCLVTFYFFSRQVKRGFLKQTDFNITVRLQDKIPARFDEFWEDAAFFVTPTVSVLLVGLLTIAAVVDWQNKKIRLPGLLIPIAFFVLVAGEVYGKQVVHHPAPPFFMIKNPTTIFPKFYINDEYSYPSGHTARAVFLGIVFLSVLSRYASQAGRPRYQWIVMGVCVVLYVLIIAVGRIYLGHHWLSDIIGGLLLGVATGGGAAVFLR